MISTLGERGRTTSWGQKWATKKERYRKRESKLTNNHRYEREVQRVQIDLW